jgi:hypothetical protein
VSYIPSNLSTELFYWQDVNGLVDQNIVLTAQAVSLLQVYDVDECTAPTSGDWVITESCTMQSDLVFLENITIENNAVVTIQAPANLRMNLNDKHILVKNGAGILVKNGAGIRQIINSFPPDF